MAQHQGPGGRDRRAREIEGLVFYPIDDFPFVDLDWRTLRNEPVSSPTSACYKTTGTASIGDHGQGATSCGGSAFPDSSGSLSYSFDLGEYHFVQLQNWPGYTDTMDAVATLEDVFTFGTSGSPGFAVTSSYAWLTNDLRQATAAGKNIVINMHNAEWMLSTQPTADKDAFNAAIRDQNVVGIFAGHIHEAPPGSASRSTTACTRFPSGTAARPSARRSSTSTSTGATTTSR